MGNTVSSKVHMVKAGVTVEKVEYGQNRAEMECKYGEVS